MEVGRIFQVRQIFHDTVPQNDQYCVGSDVKPYSVTHSLENVPLGDSPFVWQILTDFLNSFTGTFCGKSAITGLFNIPLGLSLDLLGSGRPANADVRSYR